MADKKDSMELELEMILSAWDQEENKEPDVPQTEKKQEREKPADTGKKKKEAPPKEKIREQKREKNEKNVSKKGSGHKKSGGTGKIVVTVLLGIVLCLIVVSVCFMGIYWKGKNHMTSFEGMVFQVPEEITAVSDNNGRTVSYEDQKYQRRSGTANILLIGKNPNYTFSTVVVNFDEKSNSYRTMAVPASLLAIDYSSAMNYSDIADYVSDYLCGLSIQGYMVLDMQVVDGYLNVKTDQITDSQQMEKLVQFVDKVTENASESWKVPAKVMKMFGNSFSTNMSLADLCYVYRLYVTCSGSAENEFTVPTDIHTVFQQYLNTFYEIY
ncbi:MAG: hypothetical protein ACI4TF_09690 [Oliverpabstia sp.]